MTRRLALGLGLGLAVLVLCGAAVAAVVDGSKSKPPLNAQEQHGRQLFVQTCQNCHTLAATRATGMVGPDLDTWAPWGVPPGVVAGAVREGRDGRYAHMPAGLLTGPDAAAVAAFVARTSGDAARHRGGPPPLSWGAQPSR
ncbi:MAG: hypothetical protein JWQ20_2582 [Conexibacter sp.]|nr:hypothetical protein [Conexibacter sp.]